MLAATLLATGPGWPLFEPFFVRAPHLEAREPAEVREAAAAAALALLSRR